jgi:hypothetical protein
METETAFCVCQVNQVPWPKITEDGAAENEEIVGVTVVAAFTDPTPREHNKIRDKINTDENNVNFFICQYYNFHDKFINQSYPQLKNVQNRALNI